MSSPAWSATLYPLLKSAHVGLVITSITWFAARGLGVACLARWPMQAWARHLSVAVDVALLAAGAGLWWLLGLNPLVQRWLGVKLLCLLGYIVLGSVALKRGRSWLTRTLALLAACLMVAFMVSVARTHQPWGALAQCLRWTP